MSLKPQTPYAIPSETVRVAEAAFPNGNRYVQMRDTFGDLYADEAFANLFPPRGQPAESPARLALITVMQFAEGLSDRQTAEAVRSRIDWKYALGLELTDPGFDASVLSEFRGRLIAHQAEQLLFETLLTRLRAAGLVKARGAQRTDSTHVLAAIQTLNRLELVGETLRHALDTLAVADPSWLRAQAPAEWFERYGRSWALSRLPAGQAERTALAETIGADGRHLLTALWASETPSGLRQLPAVEVLRRVWVQQFYIEGDRLEWRTAGNLPSAGVAICSPHDAEARYSQKRQTEWVGYKVHLTETCDDDSPHLITDVQTTLAPEADFNLLPTIQADLAARDLLPADHLVDAGYVSAEQLVTSQHQHQVNVLGPVHPDPTWQAKAQQGFDVAAFVMDWETHTSLCPQGRRSTVWVLGRDQHGKDVFHVRFRKSDCQSCCARERCTQAASEPRKLTIRTQESHEALQAARRRQTTEAFKAAYAAQSGIEGTLSQGIRVSDLRRSRYIGLAKTHLHHLLTATALTCTGRTSPARRSAC
ncbi:IS1182 family transposase [Candidatus Kaiserbacteria bacterium]|nr:IS1182 family transposase [Candidatus Kaiserbacteria bacterium]